MTDALAPPLILIIDDEDYFTELIATTLNLDGYTTTMAFNGQTGLELARSVPAKLLIVDIMLPQQSGLELVEQIRALPRHVRTPIILMSAGVVPAWLPPHTVFLPKPFDIGALLDLVARLVWQGGR